MDSHVWRRVYPLVRKLDRTLPRTGRRKTYSDALIVGMYLWSVGHDRPLCWACDRMHYTSLFRPRKLPSVSQFSRRIRTPRCQAIFQALHDELARVDFRIEGELDEPQIDIKTRNVGDRVAVIKSLSAHVRKIYTLHMPPWISHEVRVIPWR